MKIKRFICLAAAVLLLLSFSSCGYGSEYVSKYKAVGFIHSNTPDPSYMIFHSFEGTKVFKMKCGREGDISYKGHLESGSLKVFYDYGTGKTELFSLSGGDAVDSRGGYVEPGTVYIIVETDGPCSGGDVEFSLQ